MTQLEITPLEYKELCNSQVPHILLDIRQPWEVDKARIENSAHIPFTDLIKSVDVFSKDQKIIIYCHHGIRSLNACAFLREQGFKDVISLAGGIDAWSQQIDTTVPIY